MRAALILSVAVLAMVGCSDRSERKPGGVGGGSAKPDPKFVTVSPRFDGRVQVAGPRRLSRDQILQIAETNEAFLAWRQTKIVYQGGAGVQGGGAVLDPVVESSHGDGRLFVTMPSNMPMDEVNRAILTNDVYRMWLGNYLILDRD